MHIMFNIYMLLFSVLINLNQLKICQSSAISGEIALRLMERDTTSDMNKQYEDILKKSEKSYRSQFKGKLIVESNWEEAAIAAPMAVGFIGQLVLLANEKDFEFYIDKLGNFTYTILRQSRFRPAMTQLGGLAWKSFNTAQANTYDMSEYMIQIPRRVEEALNLLVTADSFLLEKMIPIPLNSIRKTTENSIQKAHDIEKAFVDTMYFLLEISEAMIATDSYSAQKIEDNLVEKQILDFRLTQLNRTKEDLEQYMEEIQDQLLKNQKDFEAAMKSIPTGWDAVAQNFVAQLNPTKIITEVSKAVASTFSMRSNAAKIGTDTYSQVVSKVTKQVIGVQYAVEQCGNLVQEIDRIMSLMQTTDVSSGNTENDSIIQLKQELHDNFVALHETTKKTLNQLIKMQASKIKSTVEKAFKEVSSTTLKSAKTLSRNSTNVITFIKQHSNTFNAVMLVAKKIVAAAALKDGTVPMGRQEPKSEKQNGFVVGASERFKAATNKELLLDSRRRLDEHFEQLQELNKQTDEAMMKISRLKFDTIDTEQVRAIIREAIVQLTSLKKYWGTLVSFFHCLSAEVEIALFTAVDVFTQFTNETAASIIERSDKKESILRTMKSILYKNVLQILTVSRSVKVVTETYFNISKHFVLPQINNQLLLNNVEAENRAAVRIELQKNCTQNRDYILKVVKEKKEKYRTSIEKKLAQTEKIFELFGKPTQEETKLLEETKKDVAEEMAEDDE